MSTEGNPTGPRGARVRKVASRSHALRSVVIAISPFKRSVALLAFLAVVAGLVDSALLYFVARVGLSLTSDESATDLGLGPFGTYEVELSDLLRIAGVLVVAAIALNIPIARIISGLCRRSLLRARRRLLEAYVRSSWAHRSSQPEGHLQEYMMHYAKGTEGVILQFSSMVVMSASILIIAIVSILMAKFVALLGFIGLLLISLALRPVSRMLKAAARRYARLNWAFASQIAQTARVSAEITTFDVPDAITDARMRESEAAGAALRRQRFLGKGTPILFQYLTVAALLAIIWLLSTVLTADELQFIGPLLLLLLRALSNAKQLQTSVQQVLQIAPYVEGLEEEVGILERNRVDRGSIDCDTFDSLRFDDVSFWYSAGQPVLEGVDLEVRSGDVLGVVGPSGGGKSTLTQMMVRLRPPSLGSVTVNGVDLWDVTATSWSEVMAMVPQDNALVRASVADNIRFFRSGFDLDRVIEAATAAHVHDEIMALPDGYDTEVGPGARQLSGGQRQRLGIARALLGRPQLLVLDEPTSALDQRSEQLIRLTLEELSGRVALVIVAHRPATLQICERIVLVDGGRVSEVDDITTVSSVHLGAEPQPVGGAARARSVVDGGVDVDG